jgi:hypothetical protein
MWCLQIRGSRRAKRSGKEKKKCANVRSQVTYFKKYRVADYQKKKTFERLEKEGANKVAVDGSDDLSRR